MHAVIRNLPLFVFATAATVAGCDPVDSCDEDQFWNDDQCVPCPEDSVPMGRTCVCDDPAASYGAGECKLPEPDAGPDPDDADGGVGSANEAACAQYCGFIKGCLADNMLVQDLANDVVVEAGIDGDDTGQCMMDCLSTADDDDDRVALECFSTSSAGASCVGDQSLTGVGEALGIVDGCCTDDASGLCERLCGAVSANAIAVSMVPACQ